MVSTGVQRAFEPRQESAVHVIIPGELFAARHLPVSSELALARGAVAANGSLSQIYLSGVFQALAPPTIVALLQLCRRALAPGGTLRVAVDDLDAILTRVESKTAWDASGLPDEGFDWAASRHAILNQAFGAHRWRFNDRELTRLGTLVGFRRGRRVDAEAHYHSERLLHDPLVMEFERPARTEGARPSVDILIPLYRTEFLREVLGSALAQTWEPLGIIVCDDGPGPPAQAIIEGFRSHPRFSIIRYVHNQPRGGNSAVNTVKCLAQSTADYVKLLFDDDLLEPRCVEKMARSLCANPDVTLVTSHRRVIDEAGRPQADILATARPVAEDSRLDGRSVISQMLGRSLNFIGEPSTVLFRRSDIDELLPSLWALGGLSPVGNADVTVWLSLLAQGDAIYLAETLSRFRLHQGQSSHETSVHELCRVAWLRARKLAADLGLYDPGRTLPLLATPLGDAPWWPEEIIRDVESTRAALAKGDIPSALSSINRAVEALPEEPRLRRLAARAVALRGDQQLALEMILEAARKSPDQAAPLLEGAALAAALSDRVSAGAFLDAAQRLLPLVRLVRGTSNSDGATHLEREALFELAPSLPPLLLTFRLSCRNASPGPVRPIRVVVAVEGMAVASGELPRMGAELVLVAAIPARPATTLVEVRWAGPGDALPAATDDPLAVRLLGCEVSIA
jgi:glycosyltransferase involved in cell wall biosynthesis